MAKAEWGSKRLCQGCGVKYYDLRKTPPVCPKCGVAFEADPPPRSRRARNNNTPKPTPKAAIEAAKPKSEADGDADIEPANDDLPDDTSDLGGKEEDVTAVIDGVETKPIEDS